MPNPLETLHPYGYAQEEINAIVKKYPHIVSYGGGSKNPSDPQSAIGVSGIMLHSEFDPILNKILDSAKRDMKGSPELNPITNEWGYTYKSKIDAEYILNSRPSSSGGFPGAQSMWDESPSGQFCLRVNALSGICAKAKAYLRLLPKEVVVAKEPNKADDDLESCRATYSGSVRGYEDTYELMVQKEVERRLRQQRFNADVKRELQKRAVKSDSLIKRI